jgi:hypothetical protein
MQQVLAQRFSGKTRPTVLLQYRKIGEGALGVAHPAPDEQLRRGVVLKLLKRFAAPCVSRLTYSLQTLQ